MPIHGVQANVWLVVGLFCLGVCSPGRVLAQVADSAEVLSSSELDSVSIPPFAPDSLRPDSLQADSIVPFVLDTTLIEWFPSYPAPSGVWSPQQRRYPLWMQPSASLLAPRVTYLKEKRYRIDRPFGPQSYGVPSVLDLESFRKVKLDEDRQAYWYRLLEESKAQAVRNSGLLNFTVTIPGGTKSAFSRIFGSDEVSLRVNGAAYMNIGASIQTTADPQLPPDQQRRVDPTFDQNLSINITGKIGENVQLTADWDTERPFDFQNFLNFSYKPPFAIPTDANDAASGLVDGNEDDVLRSIEMGNVTMQTGNPLIRGGSALFGVKSTLVFGPLSVTSVISQQKGATNTEKITGGSQESVNSIRPADYEMDRHFFLDYYTRQGYEQSLSNPQQLIQTLSLAEVDVWILRENIQTEEGARRAVALADLGVQEQSGGTFGPPSNLGDAFPESVLDQYRDPNTPVTAENLGVSNPANFETGFFSKLEENFDYTVNRITGTISLQRSLGAREVLAVTYSYISSTGQLVKVGDINRSGSDRIYLKMLRPKNVNTSNRIFDLTMKNIYSIGVTGLSSQENLSLAIKFNEGNVATEQLPGRGTTLLQDLGLDRVDQQGGLSPDNVVDFGTGTIDLAAGRIIFPYLEPFGDRIRTLLEQSNADQETIERLTFDELYQERTSLASQNARNNYYIVESTTKGGVQDNYTLGFALVEGSVRVTANGVELVEGQDYQVDYTFGNISILNPQYTSPGQEIEISYENQAFTSIEQKSFTGVRLDYDLNRTTKLGATIFRYNERPLDDKIRIGDEPIRNTIIGLDGKTQIDLPFLTRAVDALPLVQTRAESKLSFSGEFAQLLPGVAQTQATRRAIDRGDFFPDEERGLSFIDDFEGTNIKLTLTNATRWVVASAPAAIPGYEPDQVWFNKNAPLQAFASGNLESMSDRADLRGDFSHYSIPRNISSILGSVTYTPESQPVRITDVFPGKETQNPEDEFITTLDIHYAPNRRGIYAYPDDYPEVYENEPERTWGGMMTVLPSGQEDFTQNNIEFLEFWVQAVLPNGQDAPPSELSAYDGKLYVDLGILSEDVVPNAKLNTEDGLATAKDNLQPDNFTNPRSAVPAIPPAPLGQFSNEDRDIEDVGLDGLPNTGGVNDLNETVIFADFIAIAQQRLAANSPELAKLLEDPSNDDYMYYGSSAADGLPLHERFHRMLGRPDGNTPLSNSDSRAVTNRPDTEGLINPSIVEQNNAYVQYEIPLNPADPRGQKTKPNPYVVDGLDGPSQTDRWVQVRLPLTDIRRQFGDFNSFQNISYVRVWMSGYEKPFTLRFATFEFVGSQWRKTLLLNERSAPSADFQVASINIEENSNREPIPYRQPTGAIRAVNRGSQLQSLANEQSIVLGVENLGPQGEQLIKKTYPGGLNLVNYSNMRMFVHGEGFDQRGDMELIIRMGSDLENNYYEYRQPVSPTDLATPFGPFDTNESARLEEEAAAIWLYDENSVNINLSAFNALKQLRDQVGTQLDPNERFESGELIEDGAPGAVVAMKGNPSLTRINEIALGVRNPYDPQDPSSVGTPVVAGELWLNELRVSGFDNTNGWAANMRGSTNFADLASVSGSVSHQTYGFGALESQLGQRNTSQTTSYNLSGTFNVNKLFPEDFGLNLPISLATSSSVSTPEFLPTQGDIRFSEFESAVQAREDLNDSEKDALIQDRLESTQTVSESFSINLPNISKKNSTSPLMQYTVDNITMSYNYNTASGSSPDITKRENWATNASIAYGLSFRNVKLVRPFRFMEEVPVAGALSEIRLGVMPSSVNMSLSGSRSYGETRRRQLSNAADAIQFALQQTHTFNYNTSFGLNYNLTPGIPLSYSSNSAYDIGQQALRSANLTGADSLAYEPIPTFDVIKDMVSDTLSPRRNSFSESYSAAWLPPINRIPGLDWVTYSVRYGGGYQWANSAEGSGLGAQIGNSFKLDHSFGLNLETLYEKAGFVDWMQRQRKAQIDRRDTTITPDSLRRITIIDRVKLAGLNAALIPFGIKDISLSYSQGQSGAQAGYLGEPDLLSAIGGEETPSFLYRTGVLTRLDGGAFIQAPPGGGNLQLPIQETESHSVSASTAFQPFQNLSINLNWTASWDERQAETITLTQDSSLSVRTSSGTVQATVWNIEGNYEDLFLKQLERAYADLPSEGTVISDELGNADGRVVLGPNSLLEDFQSTYLVAGSPTSFGKGYLPFPMPNWKVSYSGVEKIIPFIGRWMQRATLSHAYQATFRSGWTLNNDVGDAITQSIGPYQLDFIRPEFSPNSVTVQQRYSPLVQLGITWKGGLTTNFSMETSRITSLALSNSQVAQRVSRGAKMTLNYAIRGFKLPFLTRFNNNINLSANASYTEDVDRRFELGNDIAQSLSESGGVFDPQQALTQIIKIPETGQARITGAASLGYSFSSRLTASAEYAYTKIIPRSTNTFERTNHDIRVNIRVSILN